MWRERLTSLPFLVLLFGAVVALLSTSAGHALRPAVRRVVIGTGWVLLIIVTALSAFAFAAPVIDALD